MLETNEKVAKARLQKRRAELLRRLSQIDTYQQSAELSKHEKDLDAKNGVIDRRESAVQQYLQRVTERHSNQQEIDPEIQSFESHTLSNEVDALRTLYSERETIEQITFRLKEEQSQSALKLRKLDETIGTIENNLSLAQMLKDLKESSVVSEGER